MNNINIEKIKQTLKNTKKMVLTKMLPFALATTFVVGAGTSKAEAANVTFPKVEITYENGNEYATESNFSSGYVTESQAKKINNVISFIDNSFSNIYDAIANGAYYVNHTKSSENSTIRLIAYINQIAYGVSDKINSFSQSERNIVTTYFQSKVEEAKFVFHDVTGISTKNLNDFANNNDCNLYNVTSNIINIKISNKKNGETKIITIDDSKLTNTKKLVIVPNLEVEFNNSKPNFKTTYLTGIINQKDFQMYDQAIGDVDIFYSKLENSLDKGNYTKNRNQTEEDIFLSVYGDTNLVSQTINEKYKSYSGIKKALNDYLNYKQELLVSKVYEKNSINYRNYINYQKNNNPVRFKEEDGFVYYQDGNELYLTIDKGYIKTSDLQSAVSVLTNVQIKASTGLNIYVDGKLYEPTDVNGNVVEPFLYNGTTYLPARAISKVFNTDIEWKNGSVYMTSKENDLVYYYDENGNKVYVNQYPEIPDTNKIPGNQLIEKTLTGRKGVKIYFNGNLFVPTNINGEVVDVFIFNGTTYLPARAISNLFNAEINWDRNLNGVVINRNQIVYQEPGDDYYYIDDNGNHIYVPEDEIDFGNTIVNQPYYIDDNGNKVYIGENDYQKTR